jgi:hypothetical protein
VNRLLLTLAVIASVVALYACDEGSDVRTLEIAVGDAGCTPAAFDVDPGQRARLLLENDSDTAFLISSEDVDIEPLEVGAHERAEGFTTVPATSGTYILNCEREGGAASEISLVARSAADLTPITNPTPEPDQPATLSVSLLNYSISPSSTTLSPRSYNIIATNVSAAEYHELNILQLQEDGSYSPIASIPPIAPQQGGAILVNLTPGDYRLACQIGIGEVGSTVDHYLQGMFVDVSVN